MFIPEVTPIQPVNVIVQQAPGPSYWLTILLSALTGAVSAILGGVFVEYVKPYMAKWRKKKMIRRLLNEEFLENFAELEAALRVLRHAEEGTYSQKSHSLLVFDEISHRVIQDRYDLYFGKEKSIFYEIDTKRRLWRFYEALGRKPQNVTPAEEHIETRLWLDRVVSRGTNYVEQAGLDYDPEKNENEEIYYELTKAEEKGVEQGRRNAGLA
jgi:hypothetical protein